MGQDVVLSISSLSKSYPGVRALDNASLEVRRGEVHAIVGENGAGKSTLIKMISGAVHPDAGTIEVFGQKFAAIDPAQTGALGISTIYQEFNVCPHLTVANNLFLGENTSGKVFINYKEQRAKAQAVFDRIGVKIDVDKRVNELTTAYVQLVEIAKALTRDAKIIIMDEPTAPLSTVEVGLLFEIIKTLKAHGVTILYISHRMGEIFEICDRITVMRDGKTITTLNTNETTPRELIHHMVDRELGDLIPSRNAKRGDVVLEARNLCGDSAIKVEDISFKLHAGEVLGIGGLVGAGRTEVARLIFGADPLESGEILLNGKQFQINSPQAASNLGIGYVPEDRKHHGAVLELSIRENIALSSLERLSRGPFVDFAQVGKCVDDQIKTLRIKTPTMNQLVRNLSGGNQQKVVFAKWMARQCSILILDEPTRGVDVGAKQEMYKLINEMAEQNLAILLITTEMEELLGLSDRLMILCEGKCTGFLEKEDFSQERVLTLASGNM